MIIKFAWELIPAMHKSAEVQKCHYGSTLNKDNPKTFDCLIHKLTQANDVAMNRKPTAAIPHSILRWHRRVIVSSRRIHVPTTRV